jgi:Rieske Fe-S protein
LKNRRDFCACACRAVSLAAIGSALPGCATAPSEDPSLPVIAARLEGGEIVLTIDAASPLAPVGGVARVESPATSFLVTRTGAETFTALTALCTHEGCTITAFTTGSFVCPCHGSRFTTDGSVRQGPASRPLRRFATRFASGRLAIGL